LCNEKYFLLWAGVGLDAFVVHRIEPRKQWEKHFAQVQYAAKAVWNASTWHGLNLRVKSDNKQLNGHYMLAVASNISLYAGGLAKISPDALLDDGLMDLWLFEGETLEDTLILAWNLFSGRHVGSDRVRCIPFQEIILESDTQMHIQLDGEPEEGGNEVAIHVIPKALKILVPEESRLDLFNHEPLEVIAG
jgi:diacylglycerol kinase family enzyme